MIAYVQSILEHQRVYDTYDKRLYQDVNVIHVIQKDGVYWGCVHEPRMYNLKREVTRTNTLSQITLDGEGVNVVIHNHHETREHVNVPVYIEGHTWMSVHRTSEFETWIKDLGTDNDYYRDMLSLGIRDDEFRFMKSNRVLEPHVNPIPDTRKPKQPTRYIPIPTRMTPKLLVASLADGVTDSGDYWFGTREAYDYAIAALCKQYPPKKRSKAACSVPYSTGQAMGYDEASASKSHMRMGWYIKVV